MTTDDRAVAPRISDDEIDKVEELAGLYDQWMAIDPERVKALTKNLRRLRSIVRDLAVDCDPSDRDGVCLLCLGIGDNSDNLNISHHAESCPYRRAVEATK